VVDKYVESVREKFKQRAEVGARKYGTTLERTDLTSLDWLLHAQEEAMDLTLYLEVLIERVKYAETLNLSFPIHNTGL